MGATLLLSLFLGSSLGAFVWAADANFGSCDSQGCSWVLENHHSLGKTQTTLRLNGPSSAISDLTAAAGWTILDCEAGLKAQTIRALCTDRSLGCDQLHEGGAEHTLVRLPENCGNGLFARVVSERAHKNQTLPNDLRTQLKRHGQSRSVRAITIDTRFGEVDPSVHGSVAFSIDGKTGIPDSNLFSSPRGLETRQESPNNAGAPSRSVFVSSSVSVSSSSAATNATNSSSFQVEELQTATLVNQTIQCSDSDDDSSFDGHITFQALMTVLLDVEYSIQISGTVTPPNVEDFDMVAQFAGSVNSILLVDILADVMIETGSVTFFQADLPGISISDVLDINPSLQLSGELNASAIADAALLISSTYNIDDAELVFPPSSGVSAGLFQQGGTEFAFEFRPDIASNGTAQVLLTPSVLFGVNFFDGENNATIGLNINEQGSVSFNADANGVNCAKAVTGISVNVDTEGTIEGVFDDSPSFVIFEDEFDVLDNCPENVKRDMSLDGILLRTPSLQKRGLECIADDNQSSDREVVDVTLPAGPFIPANSSTSTSTSMNA